MIYLFRECFGTYNFSWRNKMIQDIAEQIKKERIMQDWGFLPSQERLNEKVNIAIAQIDNSEELETKIAIIKDLKEYIQGIIRLNPKDTNLSKLELNLLMLEDFYQGISWLNNLEKSKATKQVYWIVIYNSVDRLEGVLYRIKQIQNLTDINYLVKFVTFMETIYK